MASRSLANHWSCVGRHGRHGGVAMIHSKKVTRLNTLWWKNHREWLTRRKSRKLSRALRQMARKMKICLL
jgi:hypothetical protein